MLSINPHNNSILREYEEYSSLLVNTQIKNSNIAFSEYSNSTYRERARLLLGVASVLKSNTRQYAELMTLEMGKPILQSVAEVEKCAWVCEYYAENGEAFHKDEIIATDASKSFVTFQPLGVILAVMPWNFPFWQVFRFAAPTLMAVNTALLKHASNVSGCALAIEKIFQDAGFDKNVFQTLLIPGNRVTEVIANPAVKAVSLTGSTEAGISIASTAGKFLKKQVLELGGSDPYVILGDADIELAAETCVNARLINGGQSCIAAKRFIIDKSVYPEFKELFIAKMNTRKMGDPMDEQNHIGPQARTDLRDELHRQVLNTISQGAVLETGGVLPKDNGAYYPPTVLSGVKQGMTAFDDELFGPVAPLIEADNTNHAIYLANQSVFGLGAAVFTKNTEQGEEIAKSMLGAGSCFVNAAVKSDPRLPFGGIKESGYGRELSLYGIREFVNIKTVYIK